MFYPLIPVKDLREGLIMAKEAAGQKLLIVHHQAETYIIENRCGHFGLPLDTGYLEEGTIICSQHGISFDLKSGEVSNRPYENAGPVKTFEVVKIDSNIGVEL